MLRDDVDREHLRECTDSSGYQILMAHTEATIQQLRDKLEQDASPEDTAKIRGQIAGLRLALKLPKMLFEAYATERKKPAR